MLRATATRDPVVEPISVGRWKLALGSVQHVALPIAAGGGVLILVVVGLLSSANESNATSARPRHLATTRTPMTMPLRAQMPTVMPAVVPTVVPAVMPAGRRPAPTVQFLQRAPVITAGSVAPHGDRGPCASCHRIIAAPVAPAAPQAPVVQAPPVAQPVVQPPLAAHAAPTATPTTGGRQVAVTNPNTTPDATTTASPRLWPIAGTTAAATPPEPLPFQEAHWQGLEVIGLSPGLARVLGIPRDARGVVVDEITMPADWQGFAAGDVITAVGEVATPDLESFVAAADRVRDDQQVKIQLTRKGQPKTVVLWAKRLGTANGETAPMIPAGARQPHAYLGACTSCHRIGTRGSLPVDLGDVLAKKAPPIRAGQKAPHQDRGTCTACHTIQ